MQPFTRMNGKAIAVTCQAPFKPPLSQHWPFTQSQLLSFVETCGNLQQEGLKGEGIYTCAQDYQVRFLTMLMICFAAATEAG